MTREEVTVLYGAPPPVANAWTIHTSSRSVRLVSADNGETWDVEQVMWAGERQRRDNDSLEAQRIQRELK